MCFQTLSLRFAAALWLKNKEPPVKGLTARGRFRMFCVKDYKTPNNDSHDVIYGVKQTGGKMAISKELKQEIVKKFKINDFDTGSSEVQIALLTARIVTLTEHFKSNKKDNHSQVGLVRMVNRRRKLLDYLKSNNPKSYSNVIKELGIRK